MQKQHGEVGAFLFVVELTFLKGRQRLAGRGGPVDALISYERVPARELREIPPRRRTPGAHGSGDRAAVS